MTDADPAMVSEEIKKVLIEAIKDGFSKEEIIAAKKAAEMELMRTSNDQLVYALTLVDVYLDCGKLPQDYYKHRANALKNASYKSVNDAVDRLFSETLTVLVQKEKKGFFSKLLAKLKGRK